MKLAQLGEFGLIKRLSRWLPVVPPLVGIGDDAAVIPLSRNRSLLVTTDMLIEGRHFRTDWGRFDWIGAKALRVNISDISAMGGVPCYALVALGLPKSLSVKNVEDLYRGMRQTAAEVGLKILGGDTNAADCLTIAVTVLGKVTGRPVLRSGARIGDFIYVTGTLGEAALGLKLLRAGKKKPARFIKRYWFPPIRTRVAVELRRRGVHAMIDVSDGLVADLQHILQASRVGAELWMDSLPSGGDDYELLFTHPSSRLPSQLAGVTLTKIGQIKAHRAGLKFIAPSSREVIVSGTTGFTHF